jgi:hypothetical protein
MKIGNPKSAGYIPRDWRFIYRQGKYFSFGPRLLPPGHKKLYWTAYAFIATSIFIMVLLLIVLRNSG